MQLAKRVARFMPATCLALRATLSATSVLHEGRRLSLSKLRMPIAGTCLVGVSLGLPLFLLIRERELRR